MAQRLYTWTPALTDERLHMANTTEPTPLQNQPEYLALECQRAQVSPDFPTVPIGALIEQPDPINSAKTSQQLSGETVLDLLKMILTGASLNKVLTTLALIIESQAEGMLCSIWFMEEDGVHMRNIAAPSLPESYVAAIDRFSVGPNGGSCGTAVHRREPVFVADITVDPLWWEYRDLANSHGLRACWSTPILSHDGRIWGTFAVYFRMVRSPTFADVELVTSASRIAAIAIERERSQAALSGAHGELKKSESRLRTIIDTIPTIAWCTLPDGSGEFWNRRWHDYTGVSNETAWGWGWESVIHPADLEELTNTWRGSLAAGEAGEVEGRLRRFDGEYRWFLFRYEPLRDGTGTIVNWYGTNTDIQDLKLAEQKLRQDEQELRGIIDAISQSIVVMAPDGTALYANRVALELADATIEDFRDEAFFSRILHPDDVDRVRADRHVGFSRGDSFELEMRALRKGRQYRWSLVQYNPLKDELGRTIRWYATATDIDGRKKAEERLLNENLALREEIDRSSMFEEIVGSCEPMRRVLKQVAAVAPSDSTVLILGETGTGKELIARALHRRSNRSARAFVRVNCAAIPQSLIASELFGHEKGAFTGALQRRVGRFESADGGTLFLDEIGDLPVETQIVLLRVLQEREFERVGSNLPISVDVRLIAATNRDLSAAVAAGTFREDLFYRLNVIPIAIPPLRERAEDVPVLLEYFVGRYAKKAGKNIRHIGKHALEQFKAYDWPGNIRELQNVVERAVILTQTDTFFFDESWLKRESASSSKLRDRFSALADGEVEMIEAALAECHGRISGPSGAAVKLGMPRQTLDSKIRSLGINKYGRNPKSPKK
jgi:formate hydrogenlyase transcriptional activator